MQAVRFNCPRTCPFSSKLCYDHLPDLEHDENWLHDLICLSLFEHLSVLVLVPQQVCEQLFHSLHEEQTESYFVCRTFFPSTSSSKCSWQSWASFWLAADDNLDSSSDFKVSEFWIWRFSCCSTSFTNFCMHFFLFDSHWRCLFISESNSSLHSLSSCCDITRSASVLL